MINCIIIEDEPLSVNVLEEYIARSENLRLLYTFQSLSEAWNEIRKTFRSSVLIFNDLKYRNQKTTREQVEQMLQWGAKIIFVTAYPKSDPLAKNLLINSTIGYLCKPFSFASFKKEVEKVMNYDDESDLIS